MLSKALLTSTLFLTIGCAEVFLDQNLLFVEGTDRQLDSYGDMRRLACPNWPGHGNCSLSGAVELSFNQADAYARAARQSQGTQDVTSLALLISAGWVAIGAIDGVSNTILTSRAVAATAAQQSGARYVPQNAVEALYEGASRMNCIALAGSLYTEVDLADLESGDSSNVIPVEFASFIMVLAMREVEYRTLHGTTRELEDFSSLLSAFDEITSAIVDFPEIEEAEDETGDAESPGARSTTTDDADENARTTTTVILQNPALERFFGVIGGCLDSNDIEPDRAATISN